MHLRTLTSVSLLYTVVVVVVVTQLKPAFLIHLMLFPVLLTLALQLFMVSLDISVAFDIIGHHILLKRLRTSFGISGSA